MHIPPEIKPASWGAIGGAIALAIVGFSWGGWVTGSRAETNAKERADAAVVKVLAPICAERFMQQVNAKDRLVELNKASSWERGSFIEKGGWATLPGSATPSSGVARACADALGQPKA
ncbi:MAG TPA: hypothetical protein VGD36_02790 [Xanthobacteraceae bacterium]|jgi:hypothetical protein